VPPRISTLRNSERLICRMCGSPVLRAYYPTKRPKHCPLCGGRLYRRVLDNPETMRTRIKQYRARTEPIFALMKRRGYAVRHVPAGMAPYRVYRAIARSIDQEGARKR
jgi:adenylate kinase